MEIQIRVAVTADGRTRRADLALAGSRGTMTVDGATTEFPARAVWRTVRELLPDLTPLTADPAPERVVLGALPDDLATEVRAMVVIGTGIPGDDGSGVVRTWMATDDALYAVEPGVVREFGPGAVAQTLVWDVTGAMEHLVRVLEAAS